MKNSIVISVVLLTTLSSPAFSQPSSQTELNSAMAKMPSSVLAECWTYFDLTKKDYAELIRQHRKLLPSGSPADKTTWKKIHEATLHKLGPANRDRYDQFCFQYCVGQGLAEVAAIYFGKPVGDLEKGRREFKTYEKQLNEKHSQDLKQLKHHMVSRANGQNALIYCGEKFEFKLPSLIGSRPVAENEPSAQAILVIRSPHVQSHLGMTVTQMETLTTVNFPKLNKLIPWKLSDDLNDPNPLVFGKIDKAKIQEPDGHIEVAVINVMNKKQRHRYLEILRQRWVAQGDVKRSLMGMPLDMSVQIDRTAAITEIRAAKHFRGMQVYKPLAMEYFSKEELIA